jgi:hypothetical protein
VDVIEIGNEGAVAACYKYESVDSINGEEALTSSFIGRMGKEGRGSN